MSDPATRVAQNLTEILHLWEQLLTQATHIQITLTDPDAMPGGEAMAALGPVANHEAWTNLQQATERYGRPYTSVEDELEETPLQRITYWAEAWRRTHGAEYGQDPTIATEINFIRYNLNWATVHEPEWAAFAEDIESTRIALENIVHAGTRHLYADDVFCLLCGTQLRRRVGEQGLEDEWWCGTCWQHLTPAQFNVAQSDAARRRCIECGKTEGACLQDGKHAFDSVAAMRARSAV